MNTLKFGDRVTVSTYLRKFWGSNAEPNSRGWKPVLNMTHGKNAVYLGKRVIYFGDIEIDEYGHAHLVTRRPLTVGLVALNSRKNPVYVPLDCIELE